MKQRKRVGPAAMCAIGVGCVSACLTDACVWGGEIQGPRTATCWGRNDYGQCSVPDGLGAVSAIAAGELHTVAINGDGTVACWGRNIEGQCSVPAGLGAVSAIAAGGFHTVVRLCTNPQLVRNSANLGAIGATTPREFAFGSLPAAAGEATLTIRVRADLNLATEYLSLKLDGVTQPNLLFVDGGNDCPATPDTAVVTIPAKQLVGLLADGTLTVRLEASPLVSATQCVDGLCEIRLQYEPVPVDCNANGIDDGCEVLNPANDCNDNDIPDSCDIASGLASDINANGRPDSCEPDCNANGQPDSYEIAQGTAPDCNANGKIDSCDIASGTATDVDQNGIPDSCQGDCNGNSIPDTYEILLDPSKDCDMDLALDLCEIAANPQLDCNQNGALDTCEGGATGSDCNANGVLDTCEIASGAQDKDQDGVLDDCEYARGDFDLNGTVGAADIAVILSLWNVVNAPFGDLNGDGIIGAQDLAALLSNWGPY